jgi:hypothetical protein
MAHLSMSIKDKYLTLTGSQTQRTTPKQIVWIFLARILNNEALLEYFNLFCFIDDNITTLLQHAIIIAKSVIKTPGNKNWRSHANSLQGVSKKRRPLEIKYIVKIWMPFQLHIC